MSGLLGKVLGTSALQGSNYDNLQQQYKVYLDRARQAGEQPMPWQDFVKSRGGAATDVLNPGGTPPTGVRMPAGNAIRG